MSDEQSIREQMSETLFKFYDHGTQPNALVEADALLASPVIRRIQAEAHDLGYRQGVRDTSGEEYTGPVVSQYREGQA